MSDARVRVYVYTYMYDCFVVQPPRRQPLCSFRPRGRQSVAAAAQRPYVFLMKTYVAYVFRAKRQAQTSYLMFFCPYVLLSPALAASDPRHGDSPSVLRVSDLSPNP